MLKVKDQIYAELQGALRGLSEPELRRRTEFEASAVRRCLNQLQDEGIVRKRSGKWTLVERQVQQFKEASTPAAEAPTGVEILRNLCRFHADVVKEINSSKVEFCEDDAELKSQIREPVDWNRFAHGEVAIPRQRLPMAYSASSKERVVICGPLHHVVRRKRNGSTEHIWLPVFLAHAKPIRRQDEVLFLRDGEVELNLAWTEEMYGRGDEDLLEDLLIRLGMLREREQGTLDHVSARHFGECWRALERQAHEHPWVRQRNLLAPAEEWDLRKERREGIHPVVLLFREKQSVFTKGLIEDLRAISEVKESELLSSALASLVPECARNSDSGTKSSDLVSIVEFSTLNPLQAEAAKEAFHAPLTVVQGPPGTGKSTVVRSALLTLGVHGKTAIFGSTNHKAVDAVVETMNQRIDTGSLVADLRESNRWTQLLLANLDDSRSAEGLDLEQVLIDLGSLDQSIESSLAGVRETLEIGDRMVEKRERIARLGNQVGHWADQLSCLTLPVQEKDYELRQGRRSDLSVIRQMQFHWLRWRKLSQLRRLWPTKPPPSRKLARALLDGKLDMHELASLEQLAGASIPLEEWAVRVAESVERKAGKVDQFIGRLPAVWANGVRERGQAIAEIRNNVGFTGAAGQRREEVELRRLSELLPGLPLWTVTNLSVRREVPRRAAAFDLAIIDEAGQCNPAAVLPLLFRSKRAMFVGDPQQLRPIGSLARNKEEFLRRKYGFSGTEFSRFAFSGRSAYDLANDALVESDGHAFLLREHYRCHPAIASFFNSQFYDGQLIVRTSAGRQKGSRQGISWTHVQGGSQVHGSSRWHPPQVESIVAELESLDERGFDGTVGVVTPFREHAKRIRDRAHQALGPSRLKRWDFICETADKFQGGERDLILFGLVGGGEAATATPKFYLRERNRFNVAVSRAKVHLHVFGDEKWAQSCGISVLSDLLAAARAAESGLDTAVRNDLVGPVWEPRLAEELQAHGIEFRQQYPSQGFFLDFALFPSDGRKVNVEVDGESYHRDRDGNLRAEDVRRDLILRSDGWTVQRFWVYELRENMEACISKIQKLLSPTKQPD